MASGRIRIPLFVIALALASTAGEARAAGCKERVFVNGACVASSVLRQLEAMYGTRSQPGRYWYDRVSGLFGVMGQPAFTQIAPNLPLPGRLPRDASNGDTGVFINGRELSRMEVAFLMRFGPVAQGRYWMDAALNVGFEGARVPFANLAAVMQNAQRRGAGAGGGGNTYYGNSYTGTYAGSSGGCSYVSTPSGSVMTGNCD